MENKKGEETKARIVSEYPVLARLIETWPQKNEKTAIWEFVCLAFDFGFGCGITHGLEQSAKITSFVMDRLLK